MATGRSSAGSEWGHWRRTGGVPIAKCMASTQKHKTPDKVRPAGFPTRDQVMDFITTSDQPAGKREIAKAFGLKGQEKIALKALLKDMADEGLIDLGPARAFHKLGGVPKVTVLRIIDVDDTTLIATPERWEAEGQPAPRLRVVERGKRGALTIGDRILARTEEAGRGWVAHPMKKLAKATEMLLGVVEEMADGKLWLRPVDKRIRKDTPISDAGTAKKGDLVLAEPSGRPPRISARVTDILGDPFAPRSFSLIAIHKHGIPHVFPEATEEEALVAAPCRCMRRSARTYGTCRSSRSIRWMRATMTMPCGRKRTATRTIVAGFARSSRLPMSATMYAPAARSIARRASAEIVFIFLTLSYRCYRISYRRTCVRFGPDRTGRRWRAT